MKKIKLYPQPAFKKAYTKLSTPQQDIVKLLSVIYEKITRTQLSRCVDRAGLKSGKGKPYTMPEMKKAIDRLQKDGLVEADTKGVWCHPGCVEDATCQAVFDKSFEGLVLAVEDVISTKESWGFGYAFENVEQAIRDVRFTLYRRRAWAKVEEAIGRVITYQYDFFLDDIDPLVAIFTGPTNRSLLEYLAPSCAEEVFTSLMVSTTFNLYPLGDAYEVFKEACRKKTQLATNLESVLLFQYVLRGEFSKARTVVRRQEMIHDFCYRGFFSLMDGDYDEAIRQYETGLTGLKNHPEKPSVVYHNFVGIFYLVALLVKGEPAALKKGLAYINRLLKLKEQYLFATCARDLQQTILCLQGQKGKADKIDHSSYYANFDNCFETLLGYLTNYWQGEGVKGEKLVQSICARAESSGYYWMSLQCAGVLAKATAKPKYAKEVTRLAKLCPDGADLLVDLISPQEKWQQVLQALLALKTTGKNGTVSQSRLAWLVEFHDYSQEEDDFGELYDIWEDVSIYPRLQKMSKGGKWSKGRAVALKTLHRYQKLDYVSAEDVTLCQAIKTDYESNGHYYGRKKVYVFDLKKAIPALVSHPHVFSAKPPFVQLEFVAREPELHIVENKQGYAMSLEPVIEGGVPYVLIHETLTRIGVVQMTPGFKQVAEIIDSAVEIPKKAKDMVLEVISTMAPRLAVHTDVAGMAPGVEEVEADSMPYFHLVPFGDGLRVEGLVKPFQDGGAFQHPGQGGKIVLAEIDGRKFQAERDFAMEQKGQDHVISRCTVLAQADEGTGEWLLDDPEECLELVEQLQGMQDEVVIQWPQGESFRLSATVSSSAFKVQIEKDNDWFGVTGSLQVDPKTVLDMGKLIALSRQTSSRFIKMDDGQFLALSKNLKRRIEELDSYSEETKDGVRFNPLASLALEDFIGEMGGVEGDRHWRKHRGRFVESEPPEVPSTFQAQLRDYQLTGFNWLATLSGWGVGACLADDMGLGKTVQALAAILLRAAEGPTLVIAPTSVLMNWTDEASRFAPTLNVLSFGGTKRQKMLDGLQPFDLVVSSYGLLQSEGEKLAAVEWQTVVLDEAQAIKNMATKRSKAAMSLQAGFRIITTGTPIENHLGELWNLYQFINPGLLGSVDTFNKNFAIPIEKHQDRKARRRLKKLIQPFILRRLKQDVLQELPPRTEMVLQVEMSPDEAAMYEAQRNQALAKIANAEESGSGQHMQILAEITRLRRFCCNPELVVPGCGLSSSKLKVFGDTVLELLDNGHKALVFSQFVGHLSILRKFLDEKKITYQYLDGSTPVKKRQQRIRAFQAGEGDIFLISLKAGGAGLNLTAADYVIHMDPWWNPAVEDQASDRAHRIGQKRPVTVYRLVVKDSIEEKIIALHAHKRDLADNLLEGADMAGKVSTKQLLELMKG